MKRLNRAFTLTELLVALGVVAVLTAILMPIIVNMMPNQNTLMAKRAYYTVQTLVADLINDEACYPDKTTSATDTRVGFDDPAGSPNCEGWGEDKLESTDATGKFETLFTKKLGKEVDSNGRFSTDDGMDWAFTNANFSSEDSNGGSIELTVDVNGKNKPDCGGNGNAYATELGGDDSKCTNKENGYDRFKMTIYGNGKVNITDAWAQNAVKVDRNITSDKNSNDEDEE